MNPLDYIAHESERQSATHRETLGMYVAWRDARDCWHDAQEFPSWGTGVTEQRIFGWIAMINGLTHYRRTPVFFRSGGHAVNHARVPHAMEALFSAINDPQIGLGADHYAREFLEIHPFADGNGRVGSLLWNFLRGSIFDPEPMPYFFGEE